MSHTTDSTASSTDNLATGQRVLSYAMRSFTWGMALAAAWSCSSIVLAVLAFLATAALVALLTWMLSFFYITPQMLDAMGGYANRATSAVTGLFTRKAAA